MCVTEIDLPEPGLGQVRVRIAATGVCRSDLSLARGTLRQAMPVVLGHESAGTVASTGEGVGSVPPVEAVPLEQAALVGCAVMTGVGAALKTAKVRAGQSVLVVGLGGARGGRTAGPRCPRRRLGGPRRIADAFAVMEAGSGARTLVVP